MRIVLVIAGRHASTFPEWATAIATIAAAIAALIALVGAYITIRDNRKAARERVTYGSLARLEDPALLESKAVMSAFLRGGLKPSSISDAAWDGMNKSARLATAPALWRHLDKSPSLEDRRMVFQILTFPNMLERLASMYNHNLLEEGIVKAIVEWEARSFWERADWWIKELQAADNGTFKDIEAMLEKLAALGPSRPYEG